MHDALFALPARYDLRPTVHDNLLLTGEGHGG